MKELIEKIRRRFERIFVQAVIERWCDGYELSNCILHRKSSRAFFWRT
ncbi:MULTISPECIES: hypothetical protein [Caulobacter]|uniref:Transposase n=1 Tax=Caulobacter rhizosphaerae TaxID=2010972 RepID=A0ABU1N5U9_9CAUL|nr:MULTISPECIES: hypothetical protein [Caulobacter]MDR6533311.1 hypothetical protein [Caulobacter rhizosphaerae]